MNVLLKINLSSVNGEVKKAQVELEQDEITLLQQALAYWCSNHPPYLAPNTPERYGEVNRMQELHKQFLGLRRELAKGDRGESEVRKE